MARFPQRGAQAPEESSNALVRLYDRFMGWLESCFDPEAPRSASRRNNDHTWLDEEGPKSLFDPHDEEYWRPTGESEPHSSVFGSDDDATRMGGSIHDD